MIKEVLDRPEEEDINRVLLGDATDAVAKKVAAWFATPVGCAYLSNRLDDDFNSPIVHNDSLSLVDQIPSEEMLCSIKNRIRKKKGWILMGKIAAVVIPFLFILSSLIVLNSRVSLFGESAYVEIYVPKGEEKQVVFQDGSTVYLDADSKLKYPKKFAFGQREVFLDGQGYFEVSSNKTWPFVVNLPSASIKVLGTSFNVSAYSEESDLVVQLDKGSIRVNTSSELVYDLVPGDVLTYDQNSKLCVVSRSTPMMRSSNWRADKISFEDAPLKEVVRKLNREFNVEFIVNDAAAWETYYTIVIDVKTLPEALKELEFISPLRFRYETQQNKIFVEY